MKNIGEFSPGKTVYLTFNTRGNDEEPITLSGGTISIYKRGNVTESTSGVTLSADYDGRTGYHVVAIDTSADGTFYAAGNDFAAVITAGTVDGVSVVGVEVGSFSLANRAGLRPTTADRTLTVDASGRALGDIDTIKTQTVTCSAGVTVSPFVGSTGAAINGTNANTLSSHDPGATLGTSTLTQTQVTGGAYALNSASFAFHANVNTAIANATEAAILNEGDATALLAAIGAKVEEFLINEGDATATLAAIAAAVTSALGTGSGLTALATAAELAKVPKSDGSVTWNATARASINAEVDTALADYDAPTNAEMEARTLVAASYATSTAQTTAQNDMDILTGVDGVILAANQPNYVPATSSQAVAIQDAIADVPNNSEFTAALAAADDAVLAAIAAVAADLPARITKGTALAGFPFKMVNSLNRPAGKTGLTITATRSLDGGAFSACTNAAVEISDGWYKIDLAAGDLNGNNVVLRFTGTGADATEIQIVTQNT